MLRMEAHRMKYLVSVILAACLLVCSASLSAVGPTTRITLRGVDLPELLEVVDQNVASRFEIWTGPGTSNRADQRFIVDWTGGPVAQPPNLPRFEVSFFVRHRTAPPNSEELAYVVFYEYDAATQRGFVYLPGKGESQWELNTRSIYRQLEGQWFPATAAWDEVAAPLVGRAASKLPAR